MSRFCELFPICLWAFAGFVEHDLDHVAVLERVLKVDMLFVNFCRDRHVANVGMDGVRKVDARTFFWKVDHIAFWCEQEDAIAKNIDLEFFE